MNPRNFTLGNILLIVDPLNVFNPQRKSLLIVLPITIIYSLIFITGLLGNILTCVVIVHNKKMHTASNYYLFSLAISDLLLLVSGLPQELYALWSKGPYAFGHNFCVIRGLIAETATNASVLMITWFSVERYLAICRPFASYKMSKLARATKHVICLWVLALVLAFPQALQFGLKEIEGVSMCLQTSLFKYLCEISTFCVFIAPMVLLTVLYSLIGLKLKESSVIQEQRKIDTEMNVVQRKHRKVVKMLVAVVVAFFICWTPYHAQRLLIIYGINEDHFAKTPFLLFLYYFLTYTSGVFYYMSTCINPILYHMMSNRFRKAFKNTITQTCCRSKKQVSKRCSYPAKATPRAASSGAVNSGNLMKNDKAIDKTSKRRNSNIRHQSQKQDCQYVLKKDLKNTKKHYLKASLCTGHEISKPDCPVRFTHLSPIETIPVTPLAIISEEKED